MFIEVSKYTQWVAFEELPILIITGVVLIGELSKWGNIFYFSTLNAGGSQRD